MSFTIQSPSLPVVDANRCAEIAPAMTTSFVSGAVFHDSTSLRPRRNR